MYVHTRFTRMYTFSIYIYVYTSFYALLFSVKYIDVDMSLHTYLDTHIYIYTHLEIHTSMSRYKCRCRTRIDIATSIDTDAEADIDVEAEQICFHAYVPTSVSISSNILLPFIWPFICLLGTSLEGAAVASLQPALAEV